MENQIVKEEVTVEQMEELILGWGYERELAFEMKEENIIGADIHCVVKCVPLERCKKQAFCFEYEHKTKIRIPYEIIEKIVVEKYFDGLWHKAILQCKGNIKYELIIQSE